MESQQEQYLLFMKLKKRVILTISVFKILLIFLLPQGGAVAITGFQLHAATGFITVTYVLWFLTFFFINDLSLTIPKTGKVRETSHVIYVIQAVFLY